MLSAVVLFALVTMGLKLGLALVAIYFLLPSDGSCPACEGETVALTVPVALRPLARLLRLRRRWCLECGARTLGRGDREARVWVGPAAPERSEPTR